jgi:hypothetical protein
MAADFRTPHRLGPFVVASRRGAHHTPADAGSGITTIRTTYDEDGARYLHAIATKANVLVSGGHELTDEDVKVAQKHPASPVGSA